LAENEQNLFPLPFIYSLHKCKNGNRATLTTKREHCWTCTCIHISLLWDCNSYSLTFHHQ